MNRPLGHSRDFLVIGVCVVLIVSIAGICLLLASTPFLSAAESSLVGEWQQGADEDGEEYPLIVFTARKTFYVDGMEGDWWIDGSSLCIQYAAESWLEKLSRLATPARHAADRFTIIFHPDNNGASLQMDGEMPVKLIRSSP